MLRNADEYRAGLRDGRRVIYNGEPVADVTADPELRVAVDHSALCYDITELEPELAVSKDEDGEYSTFFHVPRTPEDLVRRGRLIEAVSRLGAGTIVLKEVGSDALFGLLRATTGEGLENAREFHRRCRDGDRAQVAQPISVDGPAARAARPHRIAHRRQDADLDHRAGAGPPASPADELVVRHRAMGPDDADYAVSFAIPVDAG